MKIRSRMMLKPALSALAGDKVPLTVFDLAAADMFLSSVRVYPAPAPSNEVLKEGLLRAVALCPHLAGRLVDVNDEGVLVIEATVQTDLADTVLDATNIHGLYPTPPPESVGPALLQIQLSRYSCGGLVIGTSTHHHTADGHSMSAFVAAWASAVREGEGFVAPSPFLDRAATAVPRTTPAPVFDHRCIEFRVPNAAVLPPTATGRIKNITVHFAAEFIAGPKSRVGGRCSTFQCLLAHVWKRITAARGLSPDEFTQVSVAVNCRGRARPPVPTDFFGNMVLWAFPRLQARDVLGWSYGRVVGAIRDAVARIDSEYDRSFVDFGALAVARGEELVAATSSAAGTVLCPDIEINSWLGFRLHQLDFGTGPPSVYLQPELAIEGYMVFVPSTTATGGVDLVVGVAEHQIQAISQDLLLL